MTQSMAQAKDFDRVQQSTAPLDDLPLYQSDRTDEIDEIAERFMGIDSRHVGIVTAEDGKVFHKGTIQQRTLATEIMCQLLIAYINGQTVGKRASCEIVKSA